MSLSFDVFAGAFLAKVSEFDLPQMDEWDRTAVIDGYLLRAASEFRKDCAYDLTDIDHNDRSFNADFAESDVDEIVNIISEGMLVQWMKPFVYRQENLEMYLNTKDFTAYSPSELLLRIGGAYAKVQKDYTQMVREYSYNHGELSKLHI